jgi:hypothetical protein
MGLGFWDILGIVIGVIIFIMAAIGMFVYAFGKKEEDTTSINITMNINKHDKTTEDKKEQ